MLPAHPHPKDDEILSCWMVRLAVSNRFKLHSFYSRLLGYTAPIWNRDVDRHPPFELIELLSKHTSHPPQRIKEMSLLVYEGTLTPSIRMAPDVSSWIIPIGIFHRMRRREGMQFCPLCLADDGAVPYFRRQWRLALNCVCERHRCLLQARCAKCGQPIAYFRHDFNRLVAGTHEALATCWQCHFDLRMSRPEFVDCDKSAWFWLFDAMDVLQPIKGYAWTKSATSLSYYQGIMVLVQILSCLHGAQLRAHLFQKIALLGNTELKNHHLGLSGMSAYHRLGLLLAISYLIEEWPDRFIDCCRQCHIGRSNFMELSSTTPWWLYREVALNFDGRIYMHSPDEVVAAIRYLRHMNLRITVRNLRGIIGMTHNAAVKTKNAYRLQKWNAE